jgi:hypothetical protein
MVVNAGEYWEKIEIRKKQRFQKSKECDTYAAILKEVIFLR